MFMKCRYCKSTMTGEDNDRIGYNYVRMYICENHDCKAIYEEWTDDKGRSLRDMNQWFNPTTEDFEK